jgi:hypothetical protein
MTGAMQQQALSPDASEQARRAHLEIISNALHALTHICAVTDHVPLLCSLGGVGAALGVLAQERDNAALTASVLAFLQSLCGHGGMLDEFFQSSEIDLLLDSLRHSDNSKLVLSALNIFIELATTDNILQVCTPLPLSICFVRVSK